MSVTVKEPRMKPLAISVVLAALSTPAFAENPDISTLRPANYEFVAWSTDSSLIMLKVQDPNAGLIFQVRDAKSGDIFRAGNKPQVFPSPHAPNSDEERKFIKQLLNGKVKAEGQAVKFDQPGVAEAQHPVKSDILLMSGQKGDKLVIMGLRGDKATKYESIELIKDKKGVVAKASQKALVWDASGDNFCLIYRQELKSEDTPFEGDFFMVSKFKAYKVKGGSEKEE
jgi:hypothetical protein